MKAKFAIGTSEQAEEYLTRLLNERNAVIEKTLTAKDRYLKDIIHKYNLQVILGMNKTGLGIIELLSDKIKFTKTITLFYIIDEDMFMDSTTNRRLNLEELVELIFRKLF